MALQIKEITSSFGYTFTNVYCKIDTLQWNAITNELYFSIKPYANKEMREKGLALPIGELDLAGIVENVSADEDMLEIGYGFIKEKAQYISQFTEEEINNILSNGLDEMENIEKAVKWKHFIGAEDI